MKKERNPAIELYRVLLMFGIVLLHCVCQGRYSGIWPRYLLGFCVPGFILITGYFGVRFSLRKTIALYSTVLYACLLAPLVGGAALSGHYWREVLRVWDAQHGFWFIHAYVILTVIASLINPIFEGTKSKAEVFKIVAPLLFVVFCWGALLNYNHLKLFIPAPVGLEGASFITFLGVYIVGRMVRVYSLGETIKMRWRVAALIILVFAISLTKGFLTAGNNPVCVLLAYVLFMVVKEINLPSAVAKIVIAISPLMFAVYCIHGTIYFPFTSIGPFAVIEWLKTILAEKEFCLPGIIAVSALIAFLNGLVFAIPCKYLTKMVLRDCKHVK